MRLSLNARNLDESSSGAIHPTLISFATKTDPRVKLGGDENVFHFLHSDAKWRPWRGVAAHLLWAYYAVVKRREGAPIQLKMKVRK